MHDFIPGMVQKIAIDQADHSKIVLLYRILKDKGYLYRIRIYDIKRLDCKSASELDAKKEDETLKSAISSIDDIDEIYEALSDGGEQKYIDGLDDFGYDDDPRGIFEDFVFKSKAKVTSMNFYGGDTLTYSQSPDFYEFRVLKRNKKWTS